jgi:hypothetical protein
MSWPECFVVTPPEFFVVAPPLSATDCKALIDTDLPARNPSVESVIIVNPLGENNIHIPTGPDSIVHRPVHYWRSENFGGSAPFQWNCTGMQGVDCCTMVQKDEPQMTCHIDQPSGQDKSNLIDKPNRVYICADHSGLVSKIPVVDSPPGPICPKIKNPTG